MTTGCIEFTGYKESGYGRVTIKGRRILMHRLAWEHEHGPIPKGMYVLHKCDNRACFNSYHLFLGTIKDNALDMVSKNRSAGQKKTHCPAGHSYDELNTKIDSNGHRICKICRRVSFNRFNHKRRAK